MGRSADTASDPPDDRRGLEPHDGVRIGGSVPVSASHLDVSLGFERNRRREFEESGSDEIALGLLSRTYSADIRLHHPPVGSVAGIVGVTGIRNEFEKFGEETLIPNNACTSPAIWGKL